MAGLEEKGPVNKFLDNAHRPLKHVQSAAGRLQEQKNYNEKHKSMAEMPTTSSDELLTVKSSEIRRRSRSAPLSLEATKIAQELTRLSDMLTVQYTVKNKQILRNRRHTMASPNEHEHDRRSFHFDYQNYEDIQIQFDTISEETPEFQRGTSV